MFKQILLVDVYIYTVFMLIKHMKIHILGLSIMILNILTHDLYQKIRMNIVYFVYVHVKLKSDQSS